MVDPLQHEDLVFHVLRKMFIFDHHYLYKDLRACGVLGLIKAAETFNPRRKVKFSTHAFYYIRKEIQNGLCALSNTISYKSTESLESERSRFVLSLDYSMEKGDTFGFWLGNIDNFESIEKKRIVESFLKEVGDSELLEWIYSKKHDVQKNKKEIKLLLEKYHPNIHLHRN